MIGSVCIQGVIWLDESNLSITGGVVHLHVSQLLHLFNSIQRYFIDPRSKLEREQSMKIVAKSHKYKNIQKYTFFSQKGRNESLKQKNSQWKQSKISHLFGLLGAPYKNLSDAHLTTDWDINAPRPKLSFVSMDICAHISFTVLSGWRRIKNDTEMQIFSRAAWKAVKHAHPSRLQAVLLVLVWPRAATHLTSSETDRVQNPEPVETREHVGLRAWEMASRDKISRNRRLNYWRATEA